MVANSLASCCWLFAQTETAKVIPPPTRAILLMSLLAIALLGMLLVVIILLGGHWVRRQGSRRPGPVVPQDLLLKKNAPAAEPRYPDDDQDSGETTATDTTHNS